MAPTTRKSMIPSIRIRRVLKSFTAVIVAFALFPSAAAAQSGGANELGSQYLLLACDLDDQSRWFAEEINDERIAAGLNPVEAGHVTDREPIGTSFAGSPIYENDGSSNVTNFIAGDPFHPAPANTVSPFIVHGNNPIDSGRNGVSDTYTTHIRFEIHDDPLVQTQELAAMNGDSLDVPGVLSWRVRVVSSSLSAQHGNNFDDNGVDSTNTIPRTLGICLANQNSNQIEYTIAEYERYRDHPLSADFYFDGRPVDAFANSPISPVWQDGSNNSGDDEVIEVEVGGAVLVNATCDGLQATLTGTPGNDTITGTPGNDVIVAFAGNDIINGLGGDDTICAGNGNDTVSGNNGNDRIFGGNGADHINGNGGDDRVFGGNGDDLLLGGWANDRIFGGDGNDTIKGGIGADYIEAGDGNDEVLAGAGDDTIFAGAGDDTVSGQQGKDVIHGGSGADELFGNLHRDIIHGNSGDDFINGGWGNDSLHGNLGADELRGNRGDDTLIGGLQNDILRGNAGNDILRGNDGADELHGNLNADRLFGGNGNDRLFGGFGNDDLFGEAGTDVLSDDNGTNTLVQ